MILGHNAPKELSADTLINVAVVLTNIKKASETIPGITLKEVPLEFKINKIGGVPINRDILKNAEKSKVEVVKYLNSQGAIESFIQEPLGSNPSIRYDFLVVIKPDIFNRFYSEILELTLPHIETLLNLNSTLTNVKDFKVPKGVSDKSSPLPKLVLKVGSDFGVHEHNIISYKGKRIPLEAQVAKVVKAIMERSVDKSYTPTELIVQKILDDSRDYKDPYKYANKVISEARLQFKGFIGTQHDYFPNTRGVGYLFDY